MGIVHVATASHCCTFEIWDGDIDASEVRAHLVRLANDAEWPPGSLNLVDLTTVGAITVPDPDLVELLREGTVLESEIKTALVVRAEFIDSNAPRYRDAARATGVSTFTDLRSASEHLGIPPEDTLNVIGQLRQSLPTAP